MMQKLGFLTAALIVLFAIPAGADDSNGAGDVVRDGSSFEAEGWATRADSTCEWAATHAFNAAWAACDKAGFAYCDGSRPAVVEQADGYCRVRSTVVGH